MQEGLQSITNIKPPEEQQREEHSLNSSNRLTTKHALHAEIGLKKAAMFAG